MRPAVNSSYISAGAVLLAFRLHGAASRLPWPLSSSPPPLSRLPWPLPSSPPPLSRITKVWRGEKESWGKLDFQFCSEHGRLSMVPTVTVKQPSLQFSVPRFSWAQWNPLSVPSQVSRGFPRPCPHLMNSPYLILLKLPIWNVPSVLGPGP